MGFRINTNIAAMNAHTSASVNNRNLDSSLSKLSSGLRINTAADDASGLAIADSLRSQSSSLGQAVSNANDAIGIIQVADKAMDEQIKILDTIKTKATQAAQDGQTADTRKALQADISRLMQSLDNIAGTTSFNGKQLLSGQFTNQSFQVGAYSNQTVGVSIGATSTDKIGHVRFETTATGSIITGTSTLTFTGTSVGANATITLESVTIGSGAGQGVGALSEVINKNSELLGVRASWSVQDTGSTSVASASGATAITINGVNFTVNDIQNNDSDGKLSAAINSYKDTTGVTASVDSRGNLNLTSTDGRAIDVSGLATVGGMTDETFTGRLTLTSLSANDIQVSDGGTAGVGTTAMIEATVNLRTTLDGFTSTEAEAIGMTANANVIGYGTSTSAGVTSRQGAMAMMDIAESATKQLDRIRSDLGSAQNQLVSTVNNISITQVNVKAAESQIRDVDFASESANFSKFNILAQSGSYAMSQANAVQQNVLKLLQ